MNAMDLMDPRRRLHHSIMLAVGYVLVAIALLLLTVVLLFVAYGFGLKDGRVVQSGLLFLSSTPSSAEIDVNGTRYKNDTDTKLTLPGGTYQIELKRSGYRDWSKTITMQGGTVELYSYPFLFPQKLTTATYHRYTAAPALVTESSDHRWVLVAQPGSSTAFDRYDLNNPKQAPVTLALPPDLLSKGANEQLSVVAWANDNQHVLLKHTYDAATEYVLLDRAAADKSVNLTKAFALPTTTIDVRLRNDQEDQYYIYDTAAHRLSTAVLGTADTQLYLENVLAFAADGGQAVLYATPDPVDSQKVAIAMFDGTSSYTIRDAKASTSYLLALSDYSGDQFAAMSAASEGVAFVYRNPLTQLTNKQLGIAVPAQVLSMQNPTNVSFSPLGQYVAFENATSVVSYDTENSDAFRFALPGSLDAPQTVPSWMDGARLAYVSSGKLMVCDYDGHNCQTLVSADSRYTPLFDQSYTVLYSFAPDASDKTRELLTSTSLRTAADQ